MTEILFTVVESPEGGMTAQAVGHSIFTEADNLEELRKNVREAVECHFESEQTPKLIIAELRSKTSEPFVTYSVG